MDALIDVLRVVAWPMATVACAYLVTRKGVR